MHLAIAVILISLLSISTLQALAQNICEGCYNPIPTPSLGNRNATLDFKVTPLVIQYGANDDATMKLRLYDSKTNQTIQGTTFQMTVVRQSSSGNLTLLDDFFASQPGILLLTFSHYTELSDQQCMHPRIFANQDPFMPGWQADPNGTILIQGCSITSESASYAIHIEVITVDSLRNLISNANAPKFDENFSITNDWKTGYAVGQFTGTKQPDQIFKIYYRTNATVENITFGQGHVNVNATISSKGNSTFEVMYPRNYPYTNTNEGSESFVVYESHIGQRGFNNVDIYVTQSSCFFDIPVPISGNVSLVSINTTFYPEQGFPNHGDNVSATCNQDTLLSNVPTKPDGTISPLQQYKSGVAANDIVCPYNLELMIQPKTGYPHCVKLPNEIVLLHRGWTIVDVIHRNIASSPEFKLILGSDKHSYSRNENVTFSIAVQNDGNTPVMLTDISLTITITDPTTGANLTMGVTPNFAHFPISPAHSRLDLSKELMPIVWHPWTSSGSFASIHSGQYIARAKLIAANLESNPYVITLR